MMGLKALISREPSLLFDLQVLDVILLMSIVVTLTRSELKFKGGKNSRNGNSHELKDLHTYLPY